MSSIVIIGASGRLGLALIRSTAAHSTHPSVHAFLRTPSKLPVKEARLCTSIQQGDALKALDIQRAIEVTQPDIIIIAIGVPNSTATSHIRQDSAKVFMSVIRPGSNFQNIRVVCVSSIGAGGSDVIVGFGVGSLIKFHLRKILKDHDLQEEAFTDGMGVQKTSRLLIVRPTALIDGKPGGRIISFSDHEKVPTLNIDRDDVAKYITDSVCGSGDMFGKIVNIATAGK